MYKPFLSYEHGDAPALELFRDELGMRGASGWQDTHELRLGHRWMAAFGPAIRRGTGGFIWYGTQRALGSKTICKIEVPQALRRARKRNRGAYPVIPLFVDLRPGRDAGAIKKALGSRRGQRLLELHGVVRDEGESLESFSRRAARQYVRDLIREHDSDHLRVAITTEREPTGEHDLSLDWRRLVEDGRVHDPAALATITQTLTDIRQALQTKSDCPHITVEPHVRLPLAALIGWEWNRVRPLGLTVEQRLPEAEQTIGDLRSDSRRWGDPDVKLLAGDGPVILALSVGKPVDETLQRYAATQNATETRSMHVPVDERPGRLLSPEEICSLAQWTVDQLAHLNDRGVEKHLILVGPVSLAVRIGAAAHGTGHTWIPFWDGASGYVSGVPIG